MSRLPFLLLLAALSACAAHGPANNRLSFRFQWLSYVQGDDIRNACQQGAPDRIRLIYNADFNKVTRTFDLTGNADGTAQLDTRRWQTAATILMMSGAGNINGSLAVEDGHIRLFKNQVSQLVDLLRASHFYDPPPVGTVLHSQDYFWVGTACVSGHFMVQAYPPDRLSMVKFADFLQSVDPILRPLPTPPPGGVSAGGPSATSIRNNEEPSALYYGVKVEADSLRAWWTTP